MQIFLKLKQDPQASLLPRYQVQLDAGTLYGNSENYPKVQSDNALWFKEIFQQTAGLVGYYEILNEPDLYGTKTTGFWKGTPQEYVDLSSYVLDLHETYASNSLISQGGMTHYKDDNEDDPLLVPEVITRSLQNRLSLYAYHCHGPIENLISEKGNVRNVLTRSGFDPASVSQYNSESGLMTGRLSREILQAIALPKKILYGWAHGDCGMLVYDLRDKQGTRLNETSSDWGLTCHYFCPKPGYGTVASLVSILAGAHFEQSVYEDSLFQLYRFLRDGDTVLTLMDLERPIDGGHAITLNFDRIPYETVELIDEMGNITIIDPSAVASVNVGDFVNYIRFPGIVFSQDSVSVTKEGATDYRLRVIN
jgi:hypothetical protein